MYLFETINLYECEDSNRQPVAVGAQFKLQANRDFIYLDMEMS
jgi:hypothetical protein